MRLLLLKFFTRLAHIGMKTRGVRVGSGGWILGWPELRLKKGSVVEIGNNVTLCSMSRFNPLAPARRMSIVTNTATAHIIIKDGAGISNSVLSCSNRIVIGNHTMIGAECLITDSDFHGFPLGENRPVQTAPVEIGDYVFIGTRSIVLKGVKIGNKAVIGAGSVVASDIPENCIAAGNPARVIRSLAPA